MNAWKRYMEQDVNTSHPIKNTIYMYERCISMFRLTKRLFEDFKFAEGYEKLEKLERVFEELKLQLNPEANEDLANDLYKIYDWILHEIHMMKSSHNAQVVSKIEPVLQDLIDAYTEILKNEI